MKLLLFILFFNLNKNGDRLGGSGTTIRHNAQIHISQKITHHTQTKHSTQSYTNNIGHITNNE
jgi:hypothetical protein